MKKLLWMLGVMWIAINAGAVELENFGDLTLPGKGEKEFVMKSGRLMGLRNTARYKISFEISKTPEVTNGYVSVYCILNEVEQTQLKSSRNYFFIKLGRDVPANGKSYLCEAVFTVPDLPGITEKIRVAAYNNYAPPTASVSLRNVKVEEVPADFILKENLVPWELQDVVEIPGGDGKQFLCRHFRLNNLLSGITYLIKFDLKKDEAACNSYVRVFAVDSNDKLQPISGKMGLDLPRDNEFHTGIGEFTLPKGYKRPEIYLYNIRTTGKPVFRNFKIERKQYE